MYNFKINRNPCIQQTISKQEKRQSLIRNQNPPKAVFLSQAIFREGPFVLAME